MPSFYTPQYDQLRNFQQIYNTPEEFNCQITKLRESFRRDGSTLRPSVKLLLAHLSTRANIATMEGMLNQAASEQLNDALRKEYNEIKRKLQEKVTTLKQYADELQKLMQHNDTIKFYTGQIKLYLLDDNAPLLTREELKKKPEELLSDISNEFLNQASKEVEMTANQSVYSPWPNIGRKLATLFLLFPRILVAGMGIDLNKNTPKNSANANDYDPILKRTRQPRH